VAHVASGPWCAAWQEAQLVWSGARAGAAPWQVSHGRPVWGTWVKRMEIVTGLLLADNWNDLGRRGRRRIVETVWHCAQSCRRGPL